MPERHPSWIKGRRHSLAEGFTSVATRRPSLGTPRFADVQQKLLVYLLVSRRPPKRFLRSPRGACSEVVAILAITGAFPERWSIRGCRSAASGRDSRVWPF